MLDVKTFPLGPLETNCYVLSHGSKAVAVDPGGDPAPLLAYLEERNFELTHIVDTHLHFDHIFGNAALAEKTGAPVLASPKDEFLLQTEVGAGGIMGLPRVPQFAFAPLEPGTTTFAGRTCEVLATPGHTPGSLSLYFPDDGLVFVGDLLFYRSVGRTDFPGGSAETLNTSVREKIFTLPEETVIYSGHGPRTIVGDEKLNNPFFGAFGGSG